MRVRHSGVVLQESQPVEDALKDAQPMQPSLKQVTADELENSFPLDTGRRFREPENLPLLSTILEGMRGEEQRIRKRTAAAELKWKASVEALLANLTAAHLNVIDRDRYVAVSFNRNDYNGSELNRDALAKCRDYLAGRGLIDVAPGFYRWDADGIGTFGRRTRLRATAELRTLIDRCNLRNTSLVRSAKQLIQIKAAGRNAGPAPQDVEDSRALLTAINARLAVTDIRLHDLILPVRGGKDAMLSLLRRNVEDEGEEADANYRKRSYAGDLSAISLYRVFKYNWRSGGRIYGGWWMSLPHSVRPYLMINGSPVVELDYKTLHPLLLYHRAGAPMPDDPYLVGPWQEPRMRDLGKRTFNRLLNRKEDDPVKRLTIGAAKGDKEVLRKTPFKEYLFTFTCHLSAIRHWFGTGAGIRLQYEDSLLALYVLRSMEEQGITVLPVHDSFIVAQEHEEQLRTAMEEAFRGYGITPRIARRTPRLLGK